MAAVVVARSVACRASAAALWPHLADTERLNRAMGMAAVAFTPRRGPGGPRFLARTRLGGFDVTYDEHPFEWVAGQRFRILRTFHGGPVRRIDTTWSLEPVGGGGTTATMRLEVEPRLRILAPVARFRAGQTLAAFAREMRRIDDALARDGGRTAAPPRHPADPGVLAHALGDLRKTAPTAIVDRLERLVREGADVDVARIRPYELADAWGLERRAVLVACLAAVKAGLLELRWEVICPSCRLPSQALPSLSELADHGDCPLCDIRFDLDLDAAVEATFAPAASVRRVDVGPYCIGGPRRTPHVAAQALLPAAGRADLAVPDEVGRYRLFVRGGAATPVEVAAGAPGRVTAQSGALPLADVLRVEPGGVVEVENQETDDRHAKLERLAWISQAASAREVTTLAAFRREFSSDTVRPGLALKVSRVAIFFSDLTGSTKLYADVGDAAAFKLVHEHFDVVIGLVDAHGGTLVKTIGDAVMSAFADEVDGLRASLAILAAFEQFRQRQPDYQRTHIKLGLYAGPCYAVTANGVLDYFGQTVNIAARLQAEARSGELVVEAPFATRALAAGLLDAGRVVESYDARLKGVEAPMPVTRVRGT